METNFERRDKILELRSNGLSYRKISEALNCAKSTVAFYCNKKRYDPEKEIKKEAAKLEYEKIVCEAVAKCQNINQVCKYLGKKATNTNYRVVDSVIKKYNLDTSHFCVDYTKKNIHNPYTREEIFVKDSPVCPYKAKLALFKYGLKEWKCEKCGRTEWEGEEIPLQIHHINGNNRDNRLENLQVLCPNCHAQTDTYCGKKKRRNFPEIRVEKQKKSVEDRKSKKNSLNISRELLIEAFREHGSFLQVGKLFGVSDNAVRKWCKSFNLPEKTKEMQKFFANE